MPDEELRETLRAILSTRRGRRLRIDGFERRSSRYQTSATLEEIDVVLDGGEQLQIIFKDLGREAMQPEARRIKPLFLHDPLREIEVYRSVLAVHQLGTAFCHGAIADEGTGRYWLFLERVPGLELYQVGELAAWRRVASWLAAMHTTFAAAGVPSRASELHAIRYDGTYCRLWIDRALAFFREGASAQLARDLAWLVDRHPAVIDRLTALPTTFLHGELYASNVLVQELAAGWRVCPIDWEMAAVGPGLIDLAALVAGNWSEDQRQAIASAYYDALGEEARPWSSRDAFFGDLDCCRIQIAVQWLGWFGRQRPPAEHARDWLGDAIATSQRLGL